MVNNKPTDFHRLAREKSASHLSSNYISMSRLETEPTLTQIEAELQARVAGYPYTAWGRQQNNAWDERTRFIYDTPTWEKLQQKVTRLEKSLADYAVNRWFNFWSARAVEKIFGALPGVTPQLNPYDRLVDFSIQNIQFDHKTTVFPEEYPYSPEFAQAYRAHLIRWLYRHQSKQQRYHRRNRLFIVLCASDGEHWKLRAEVNSLGEVIRRYVANFQPANLAKITLGRDEILADLIWFIR